MAQLVKNLPAMWETWVQSLDWEDPLEEGMATTPIFWPGEFLEQGMATIPIFWPGEFHGLCSPWGRKESDTTE